PTCRLKAAFGLAMRSEDSYERESESCREGTKQKINRADVYCNSGSIGQESPDDRRFYFPHVEPIREDRRAIGRLGRARSNPPRRCAPGGGKPRRSFAGLGDPVDGIRRAGGLVA